MKLFVLLLSSLLILGACSNIERVNLTADITDPIPESEVPKPDDNIDWTPIEPINPIEPEAPKLEMLKSKFLVRVVNSNIKIYGEISADGKIFNFGYPEQDTYTTRYENNDYSKGIMVHPKYQDTGIFNKTFSYDAKNNTVNIHTGDGGIFQLIDSR